MEKKYADVVHCKYEEVRLGIFKDCPHAGKISTPHTLCEEMIDQLPDLNGKLVLVLFNPEFYLSILRRYPEAKIVMVTGSANACSIQKKSGFKGVEEMILADPFDFESVKKAIDKYEKYGDNK